jgi:general secretion pathway protein H
MKRSFPSTQTTKLPSKQQAFTLIEVMVVLVIIGLMLGMATLSTGGNEQKHEAQQQALRFIAQLDAYRNEAVFQNLDLGLAMDGQTTQLLKYTDTNNQAEIAGKDKEELSRLENNPWAAYQGNLKQQIEFPEYLNMSLFIEDKLVDFEELLDEKEGPKPALLFLSSDEYTPFKLNIEHYNDESFTITITGDGFSRFVMKTDQYEQ